jgi:hypothetical protein
MKASAVRPRAFHHSLAVANDSLRDRTFCCPMSQSGRLEPIADTTAGDRRFATLSCPMRWSASEQGNHDVMDAPQRVSAWTDAWFGRLQSSIDFQTAASMSATCETSEVQAFQYTRIRPYLDEG